MLALDPIVDNQTTTLEEVYKKVVPLSEEIRISTGYFYLSGFDLVSEHLENLASPETLGRAPMRILMGRRTDTLTADEIEEGLNLRKRFKSELEEDIEEMNRPQIERLHRLKDFIGQGLIDVRVRTPEAGYYHAKGACFRGPPDDPEDRDDEIDRRGCVTIVGSSNFTESGQRRNIELNMTSQDRREAEAFESWFDNQWANAEEFSQEIVRIIESSGKYQEWKEEQEAEPEDEPEDDVELGTFIEPFELYKLLAYDELNGNVSIRDSPLYYFQKIGYESAKEKLSTYNGCIISDSVGLGKSFIGSELLYDYRQRGKRCLLILPANLTDQWIELLEEETDENGEPYFGLEVDGTHIDIISISKFQNLTLEDVQELDDKFDVVLIDEAHRFRNHGQWKADASSDDDYTGTRRHANLRQLRGNTMIMLTATPINNSATDLKNLISLFTSTEELRNKASLDFSAFDEYIDLSARRKRIAAEKEEVSAEEERRITEQLSEYSREISEILNEVMVLRTRKHVKDQILESEDFEFSFEPPVLHKEEYSLPPAYQPIYDHLPDVMDALHLPHITIKNPGAGTTLKALYKLNLLKRLESSTYAFVQSLETLHQSERQLLNVLETLPDDEPVETLRTGKDEESSSLQDFVEGEDAAEDLEEVLEEFGFDSTVVEADTGDGASQNELADATIGEVKTYIREDLTLLAFFLSMFIGDVAEQPGDVNDYAVSVRQWLQQHNANHIPDVPEDEINPILYQDSDLTDADTATRDFYDAVFSLREFRDPKIEQLGDVLHQHDEKILIFTQYRATADYVYRALRDDPHSPLTESNSTVVKGGDRNKQDIIKRFTPESSGYQQTLQETGESELDYVVATDTLSEGVNLQDVHVAVNYDLPWNPMRIVQRVGRIDRIGSTAEKHVHNFYPDGDIEAAIRLLKRLQAKISDIALIVGKENNILDPNENQLLDRVDIDTEKTIGELEIEEIERSLRTTREKDDVNELDDTSKNPLLRHAGSNEDEAFERYLLKLEINDEFGLSTEDFDYAEEYFEESPNQREFLYTNVKGFDAGPRPGVFGLAHLWFDDDEHGEAPLGRVRRAFYYKPFGDDEVKERTIRMLGFDSGVNGEPLLGDVDSVITERDAISSVVRERVEKIRERQVEGIWDQGSEYSKQQEMILDFLSQHISREFGDKSASHPEFNTTGQWVEELYDSLKAVKLKNTDEDRILREKFRQHPDHKSLREWPVTEFMEELQEFMDQFIDESVEFQETLVGESEVRAELICWGVVNR